VHGGNALCGMEGELKVVSSVVSRKLLKVKRVRVETVNECAECKSVSPASGEVRHVHALHSQEINQSANQPINQSINQYLQGAA